MDRSLDEIISERPRGPRRPEQQRRAPPSGPRAPRREEYPRDGVRKYRQDEPANINSDWVHDRFEDDRYDRNRQHARSAPEDDRYASAGRASEATGARLRVDNVHYDLTEDDLRGLFERIGPTTSIKLLYDRMDRSQGTAFVTFADPRDARDAVRDYDGQNANGQPIKISILPSAPAAASKGASLFDRIERPPRSMFERIEGGGAMSRDDSRDDTRRRRRERDRSDSPRKGGRGAVPEHVDRYVPGARGSRSPIGRRGTPRESGRRPGAKREESGRGGGGGSRRARTDDEGRPLVGGRPRKTAEELDAEMADYWGSKPSEDEPKGSNGAAPAATTAGNGAAPAAVADGDIDMVE